jgi:transposase
LPTNDRDVSAAFSLRAIHAQRSKPGVTLQLLHHEYAEATASQQGPQWIRVHTNALEYFGGSPHGMCPDNLKSAVTQACRYEPKIHGRTRK